MLTRVSTCYLQLVNQLAEGGRMVIPVGAEHGSQVSCKQQQHHNKQQPFTGIPTDRQERRTTGAAGG